METVLNFLVENYLWFLIISLILIFGLIGYIVDSHEKKAPKLHFEEDNEDVTNLNVQEDKSLKELLAENNTENNSINLEGETEELSSIVMDNIIENPENNKNELPNE